MGLLYKYINAPHSQPHFLYCAPYCPAKKSDTKAHDTVQLSYAWHAEYLKNSSSRHCSSIWNDLPGNIISKSFSIDSFKIRLNSLKPGDGAL